MALPDNRSEDISLLDCWSIVWKNRLLLAIIVVISVVGTALGSLLLNDLYEARAIMMPAGGLSKDQTASALVAMQFGLAAPASPAAAEITNLLKSNILSEKIIKKYKLAEIFFEESSLIGKSEEKKVWGSIRYLRAIMKVNFLQKDNIIQLSVQFKDPRKATDIVTYALTELNDHMSSEAKRVADTNKKYLESQIDRAADPYIRAKIYSLIAQQIETSMMAEAKENFAFKVLDPPSVPDKKVSPNRTQMVIIALVASLFLGIFVTFVKEYVRRTRTEGESYDKNIQ